MNNLINQDVDILIINATIITMNKQYKIYKNSSIAIQNDKIKYIDNDNLQVPAKQTIDAAGMIIMPGLINTHTHAAMTIFRGFADDLPLMDWLNNYIWPAEAKYINKKTVKLGTQLAAIEMIKSGTTTFNDMYFFEDETATVCKEIGIRAVLGEAFIDIPQPIFKVEPDYYKMLIEKYKTDTLIRPAIVAHATYTCSTGLLQKLKKESDKFNLPFHIHIAETEFEFENFKRERNMTPVAYLDSIGVLDHKTIAVHSVHLTDDDIEIYRKRDVKVSHNPESNLKLASGISPIVKFLTAGIKVGLGTDGAASNNNLNMFEEMNMVAKVQKAMNKDTTVLPADTVLKMATIDGAKVLGIDNITGSLEEGKKADMIFIDLNKPHLTPMYNPYSHLVYAVQGSDVDTVIINGKIVMKNRKLITINENEVMGKVNKLAAKIKENN